MTFCMKLTRSVLALSLVGHAAPALASDEVETREAVISYEDVTDFGEQRVHSGSGLNHDTRKSVQVEPVLSEVGRDKLSERDTAVRKSVINPPALDRAIAPFSGKAAAIGGSEESFFPGGKLLLTNGVSTVEGTSGGGLATWATIAGRGLDRGLGASAHVTAIELPDFGWRSYGFAIGIADRLELSYARQNFDTRSAGAALGLGRGYTFNQDVYGAKLRVVGDAVYGATLMPQIAIGAQYKRSLDRPVIALLGAGSHDGLDFTLSATKLLLEYSVLLNATARLSKGNQLGLLGFGSAAGEGHEVQFEGSIAYQLSRRAVVGAEFRSKPDKLGLGENDWIDIFAAYALTRNITVSAAYVDLGSIATFEDQRGGFVQAQLAF